MRDIDISISIVTRNAEKLLDICLASIFEHKSFLNLEVYVVDNASILGSIEKFKKKYPSVIFTSNKTNRYFTRAHNQNLKKVQGKYFLVLNDDTYIPNGVLSKIVNFLENNSEIGIVGCRQINEEKITEMTCTKFPLPWLEFFDSSFLGTWMKNKLPLNGLRMDLNNYRYISWDRKSNRRVDTVSGAFFFGRSHLLKKIGLFDEQLKLYFEEPDYCLRALKAGYYTFHLGKIFITHLHTQTIKNNPSWEKYVVAQQDTLAYYKKHFGLTWFLLLWLSYRPNWTYWRLRSLIH